MTAKCVSVLPCAEGFFDVFHRKDGVFAEPVFCFVTFPECFPDFRDETLSERFGNGNACQIGHRVFCGYEFVEVSGFRVSFARGHI